MIANPVPDDWLVVEIFAVVLVDEVASVVVVVVVAWLELFVTCRMADAVSWFGLPVAVIV